MSRYLIVLAAALAVPTSAFAVLVTGPSSTQAPYLVPVSGGPAFDSYSIITSGNKAADGYQFNGTPDGVGAYSNGDGTFTVLVNHEFGSASGIVRAHGGTGSYVSRMVVDGRKEIAGVANPNFLKVISGKDLDDSVETTTNGSGGGLKTFARYCSSDLAPVTAYYNAATGKGTQNRILLNGEENGANSRSMAHVIDVNGANTGVGYQLPALSGLNAGWENLLAHPNLGDTTLVMANADGGANRVYAYIGTKSSTGSELQKSGLLGGTTYGVQVKVNNVNVPSENLTLGLASSGAPVYNGRFTLSAGDVGTTFLRPEDGAWDPVNPSDYYFVTTSQYDTAKDGLGGAQVGRSRLWRMRYDDLNNLTAGGTIEALLDGTELQQMMDNIAVVNGVDGHTRIMIVEDVGGNAHNGKVLVYDTATDALSVLGKHFASNGDIGVAVTAPFNNDEEFSGVIDARDILGDGWFLTADQQHYGVSGAQVEGGQLIAFYAPTAIPEPSALSLIALPALGLLRRRR